jgi:ABC-type sugar transport system permease subunit
MTTAVVLPEKASAGSVSGPGPGSPRPRRLRNLWPIGYIVPALLALGLTFGYSFVEVVRYSFYSGSVGSLTFVGLANYRALFADPIFTHSLFNNLRLLGIVPIVTVLALVVALTINRRFRGWRYYRAIIFLPYILPATAMGLAFSYLLQGGGVVDTLLKDAHLNVLVHDWLGSPSWVIFSIGAVVVWQQLGFGVVLFAAALLKVPVELTEAAQLDGATWWRIQRSIMIPQIRRIIELFVVIEAITALSSVFTYVYVLTGAGPAYASSVMEFYIYQNGFENGAIGIASTAAIVLLGIASIFIVMYLWLRTRATRESA